MNGSNDCIASFPAANTFNIVFVIYCAAATFLLFYQLLRLPHLFYRRRLQRNFIKQLEQNNLSNNLQILNEQSAIGNIGFRELKNNPPLWDSFLRLLPKHLFTDDNELLDYLSSNKAKLRLSRLWSLNYLSTEVANRVIKTIFLSLTIPIGAWALYIVLLNSTSFCGTPDNAIAINSLGEFFNTPAFGYTAIYTYFATIVVAPTLAWLSYRLPSSVNFQHSSTRFLSYSNFSQTLYVTSKAAIFYECVFEIKALLLKIFFGLPQESEILRNGNRVCFKLLLWANRQTADSDPFFIKSNIELFINGSRNNHINLPLIRKQLLQTCAARSEKPAYSVQDFSSQIWQIIRTILLALVPSVLGSVLVALFHI